jgi:hypothetical protein
MAHTAPLAPSRKLIRKVLDLKKRLKAAEEFKEMQIRSHKNLKRELQARTERFEQFYADSAGKNYLG